MRALLLQVTRKMGIEFEADSCLLPWAVRHAGWLYSRFNRRQDSNMTPIEKIKMARYAKPLLMFGECCICRRPGAQLNKLDLHWLHGVWLGRDAKTDEHYVGTETGIVRARAIRRMVQEQQWVPERVCAMRLTPWRTGGAHRGRLPKPRTDQEPIMLGAMPASAYSDTVGDRIRAAVPAASSSSASGGAQQAPPPAQAPQHPAGAQHAPPPAQAPQRPDGAQQAAPPAQTPQRPDGAQQDGGRESSPVSVTGSPHTPPPGEVSAAKRARAASPRGSVRESTEAGGELATPDKRPRLPVASRLNALREMQALCEEETDESAELPADEPGATEVEKAKRDHIQMLCDPLVVVAVCRSEIDQRPLTCRGRHADQRESQGTAHDARLRTEVARVRRLLQQHAGAGAFEGHVGVGHKERPRGGVGRPLGRVLPGAVGRGRLRGAAAGGGTAVALCARASGFEGGAEGMGSSLDFEADGRDAHALAVQDGRLHLLQLEGPADHGQACGRLLDRRAARSG